MLNRAEQEWSELVTKAKAAIANGVTRGRFIRENSSDDTPKLYLQLLSDAYSEAGTAMREWGSL